MENLRTAFSLAFLANKHFSIYTDDYESCVQSLKTIILPDSLVGEMVQIDLQQCQNYSTLATQMIKSQEGKMPELYKVIIWKNLEALELNLRVKSDLLRVFDEIERYNTVASKSIDKDTPIKFGGYSVRVPDFFIIVPVMSMGEKFPMLHRQVKDRFWFCQSHYHTYNQEILATQISIEEIAEARKSLASVYSNAEIQEYVCSLMVFTRSHRLCSLAPLTTRPSMRVAEGILLLAKTLALWANHETGPPYFVTPDFVKVAYRKVGYWVVDWQTNWLFQERGMENRKRTEISLLTGDWYGSEWSCVEKYLDDFRAREDSQSTTGFSNRIIEDVLKSVSPPL